MVEQAKANSDELFGSSQLLSIDPRTLQRLELLNSGKNLQVWVAPCRGSPSLHALAACDSRMDLVAQKMVPNIPKDPKAGGF